MSGIYFDITDLVHFVRRQARITGIQRVELNILREMVSASPHVEVKGLILDEHHQARQIDLSFLRDMGEFDAGIFLRHTSVGGHPRRPDPLLLKRHLDRFKHRKVHRAVEKLRIYAIAALSPKALSDPRLPSALHQSGLGKANAAALSPSDMYVSLGASWDRPSCLTLARTHAATGGRVVQMVHDLIPIVTPELHKPDVCTSFTSWLASSAKVTSLYLCISQNTYQDLSLYLRSKGLTTPIAVTPLAHEFIGFPRGAQVSMPADIPPELQALKPQQFVLCVGSIEPRKNGHRLIQAWRNAIGQVQGTRPNLTLVFAGRRSWLTEQFEQALKAAHDHGVSIVVLEHCSDHALAWLYSHATFTVFPSLYEGWGLPVGESMWFHTPCLAANGSAIPEVGGAWVDYVDPEDTTSITQGLLHLLAHPSHIQARAKALSQAPLRSWSQHAQAVREALLNHRAETPVSVSSQQHPSMS